MRATHVVGTVVVVGGLCWLTGATAGFAFGDAREALAFGTALALWGELVAGTVLAIAWLAHARPTGERAGLIVGGAPALVGMLTIGLLELLFAGKPSGVGLTIALMIFVLLPGVGIGWTVACLIRVSGRRIHKASR